MEKTRKIGRPAAPALELKCAQCGVSFHRKSWRKRATLNFCSRACSLEYRRLHEKRAIATLPEQDGYSTIYVQDGEDIDFLDIPYYPSLFPSNIDPEKLGRLITPVCAKCGNPFIVLDQSPYSPNHQFICSPECRRKLELTKPRKTQKLNVFCSGCKKQIQIYPSKLKENNFCSRTCFRDWQKKKKEDLELLRERKKQQAIKNPA